MRDITQQQEPQGAVADGPDGLDAKLRGVDGAGHIEVDDKIPDDSQDLLCPGRIERLRDDLAGQRAQPVQQAVEKGFVKISLGNSILRTETAAIASCHILNLIQE